MPDSNDRLVRCFASVFPTLTADQIYAARMDTVSEWDSLASVTLVAVVQQEFGIEIDLADLPELDSFRAVKDYLGKRNIKAFATETV